MRQNLITMKRIYPIFIMVAATASLHVWAQNSLTLSFTGVSDTLYFQLESIKVKNLTQGGETTLYYPDTMLILYYTGTLEKPTAPEGFSFNCYPNPLKESAFVQLYVPSDGQVIITISDMLGRQLLSKDYMLQTGHHQFRIVPGVAGTQLLTASWKGMHETIRLINTSPELHRVPALEYSGPLAEKPSSALKSATAVNELPFSDGDILLFIGAAGGLESGIVDSPEVSTAYTFQFATNIPCPGLDSVLYEGQWYHTVQIFSQCWLSENLNVGNMIQGTTNPSNNGIIEKYCFGNTPSICENKGGLYQWEEMMNYTTEEGAQGICPAGFHLPSDEEWKVLEGVADSQYGIGHYIWNSSNFRGFDVAYNLKAVSGWASGGNGADLEGFKAIPAGYWWENSFFENNTFGIFWTSTSNEAGLPIYRGMRNDMVKIARMLNTYGPIGHSVRCIKD